MVHKINKSEGITLVVLVITIIILLILAGITIVSLSGENGLLSKIELAKQKVDNSQMEENAILADYENKIPGSSLGGSIGSFNGYNVSLYDKKTEEYKAWSAGEHTLSLSSEIEQGKYIIILNANRSNQSDKSLTEGSITFDNEDAIELSTYKYNDAIYGGSGAQLLTINKTYFLDSNKKQTISTDFTAGWAMNMNYVMTILKLD